MSYVKKVQKGTTEYDIHDTRVPEATSADEDKVLKVNASGQYELGEAGGGSGGGTQLYKHTIPFKYQGTTETSYWIEFISTESTAMSYIYDLPSKIVSSIKARGQFPRSGGGSPVSLLIFSLQMVSGITAYGYDDGSASTTISECNLNSDYWPGEEVIVAL